MHRHRDNILLHQFTRINTYFILLIGIFFALSSSIMPCSSDGSSTRRDSPPLWYLAVLPARWMYVFASSGQSNWTTQFTSGKSGKNPHSWMISDGQCFNHLKYIPHNYITAGWEVKPFCLLGLINLVQRLRCKMLRHEKSSCILCTKCMK